MPQRTTGVAYAKAVSALLAEVTDRYDIVLVDSDALLQTAAAAALVVACDAAVIVVDSRDLVRDHRETAARLDIIGSEVLGYVYDSAHPRFEPDEAAHTEEPDHSPAAPQAAAEPAPEDLAKPPAPETPPETPPAAVPSQRNGATATVWRPSPRPRPRPASGHADPTASAPVEGAVLHQPSPR
jgi:hypothetical protein